MANVNCLLLFFTFGFLSTTSAIDQNKHLNKNSLGAERDVISANIKDALVPCLIENHLNSQCVDMGPWIKKKGMTEGTVTERCELCQYRAMKLSLDRLKMVYIIVTWMSIKTPTSSVKPETNAAENDC